MSRVLLHYLPNHSSLRSSRDLFNDTFMIISPAIQIITVGLTIMSCALLDSKNLDLRWTTNDLRVEEGSRIRIRTGHVGSYCARRIQDDTTFSSILPLIWFFLTGLDPFMFTFSSLRDQVEPDDERKKRSCVETESRPSSPSHSRPCVSSCC